MSINWVNILTISFPKQFSKFIELHRQRGTATATATATATTRVRAVAVRERK